MFTCTMCGRIHMLADNICHTLHMCTYFMCDVCTYLMCDTLFCVTYENVWCVTHIYVCRYHVWTCKICTYLLICGTKVIFFCRIYLKNYWYITKTVKYCIKEFILSKICLSNCNFKLIWLYFRKIWLKIDLQVI